MCFWELESWAIATVVILCIELWATLSDRREQELERKRQRRWEAIDEAGRKA